MNLDPKMREALQHMLRGMSAGFTLEEDRLHVRFGDHEFGFILYYHTGIEATRCYCCTADIVGEPRYWAEVTERLHNQEPAVSKKPLCFDCAVPQ